MNRNEKPSLLKGKAIAVGIVICFVAVIAIAGAYTFNNYQKQIDEQVAKAEQQAEELAKESEETTADDIVLPEEKDAVQEDRQKYRQRKATLIQMRRQLPETIHQASGSARTVFLNGRQAALL